MDGANTEADIDEVLDNPSSMSIINSSGWDITVPINIQTKDRLIQGLIYEEVIGKRERQITALRKGL